MHFFGDGINAEFPLGESNQPRSNIDPTDLSFPPTRPRYPRGAPIDRDWLRAGHFIGVTSEGDGGDLLPMLRLIAGDIYPSTGSVVVPAAVRTLLLEQEPEYILSRLYLGCISAISRLYARA